MANSIAKMLPNCEIWMVGCRHKQHGDIPQIYYYDSPDDLTDYEILVVDPIIASGKTFDAVIPLLNENGATFINYISIIAAPSGIEYLNDRHDNVALYVAMIDEKIGRIGDVGDRLLGTKILFPYI